MRDINSFSNYQIVTIVLLSLGGVSKHIDREDIAIKANEMAPGRFNWRKYPNRIDLDAVGSALRDAKKEKNGQLVVGNNVRGWMLSPNGLQWLSSVRTNLNVSEAESHENFIAKPGEIQRLRNTKAYELFQANKKEDITKEDFNKFARIDEYFKDKAKERRVALIDNIATLDKDVESLWIYLKERFAD